MNKTLRGLLLAAGILVAGSAAAQVTFYQDEGFGGQSFTTDRNIMNFQRWGFNDKASSVSVRGGAWEVCTDARLSGRCVILRSGDYPDLGTMGLNDRISSVREVQNYGYDRRYDNRYGYDRGDNRWNRREYNYYSR